MYIVKHKKIFILVFFVLIAITIASYDNNSSFENTYTQTNKTQDKSHSKFEQSQISIVSIPEKQNIQNDTQVSVKPEISEQPELPEVQENEAYDYPDTNPIPATNNNVSTEKQDAFFNQINQERLTADGIAQGYLIVDENSITPEATTETVNLEVQDETAPEINQQAIIDNARLMGYVISKPNDDVELPTNKNATLPATGEFADQINR